VQQLLLVTGWPSEVQALFGSAINWLKEWQFLVGTIMILLAGTLMARSINRQTRRLDLEAIEGHRRLVRALRGSMPDDLEAICSYARRSAEVARQAVLLADKEDKPQVGSVKARKKRLRCPNLPGNVLANIKELIVRLDHDSAEKFAELLACYHIQRHRLADALQGLEPTSIGTVGASRSMNFNPVFKSTLELYLRTMNILPFARGETESIPETFDGSEILYGMKALNIDNVMSPEARQHCLQFKLAR
jgi:hypothetical protein